jgi:hypothetical protein
MNYKWSLDKLFVVVSPYAYLCRWVLVRELVGLDVKSKLINPHTSSYSSN